MSHAYAYCLDCHELTHGIMHGDSKGFRANAGTNTHWDHDVQPFGDVRTLPRPIFNVIARLDIPQPITENAITMFRLGLDLHDYPTGATEDECQPAQLTAPVAASDSATTPALAVVSAASTRSRPALTLTSITSAADDQPSLFDEYRPTAPPPSTTTQEENHG